MQSEKTQNVTLAELCLDVWNAKKIVLFGAVFGLLFSGLFVMLSVPHFRAQMILSPTAPMGMIQTSSVLGDQDLFALQQILKGLGHENKSEFSRFEHMYATPSVASKLLEDPKVQAGLERDRTFNVVPGAAPDTPEELARYIERRVRLEHVAATSMRRMVFYHPSRDFGIYFLHSLHQITDALISGHVRRDTQQRITYLKSTLNKKLHPEHKRALTSLLLEQERLNMLVSGQTSYAARVAEPPYASVKVMWPNMAFVFSIVPLVFAMGFYFLSRVFVFRQVGDFKNQPRSYKNRTLARGENENGVNSETRFSSQDAAE